MIDIFRPKEILKTDYAEKKLFSSKLIDFGDSTELVKQSWSSFEKLQFSDPSNTSEVEANYKLALNDIDIALKSLKFDYNKYWQMDNRTMESKLSLAMTFVAERKGYFTTEYGLNKAVEKGIFSDELGEKLLIMISKE